MKILSLILALFIAIPAHASIVLNGSTQYLISGNFQTGLNGSKTLSMSAWVDIAPGQGSSFYVKLLGKESSPTNQAFNLGLQDCSHSGGTMGMLCVTMGADNVALGSYSTFYMANSTIPITGRHLVGVAWNNATGTLADFTFYLDNNSFSASQSTGFTLYSSSTAIEDNYNNPFGIGAACGNTCPYEWYPGAISEIKVWNTKLSSGDFTSLWNSGVPGAVSVQPSYLQIYYPLNDFIQGTVTTSPNNLGSMSIGTLTINYSPIWSTDLRTGSYLYGVILKNGTIH